MQQPPNTDRRALAAQIGELEGQLSRLEGMQRQAERDLAQVSRNRIIGAVTILVGLFGFLAEYNWFGVALGFVGLVGLVILISALISQGKVKSNQSSVQGLINTTRSKLAESRALIQANQ